MDKRPLQTTKTAELLYIVMMDQTRIKGNVHLPAKGRLSDFLNHQAHDKPFLAITEATLLFPNGDKYTTPFIVVNRLNINSAFPAPQDQI